MVILGPKLHNEANLLSKQALKFLLFSVEDKEVELKFLYSK